LQGVKQTTAAYKHLAAELKLDAIVLCDGGSDSVMFGNEEELGTPTEDMTSIASVLAVDSVPDQNKILTCIGLGIDTFHGVCHARFFENVAAIAARGGFLGSFSLLREMAEAQLFARALQACQPENSIVCTSM
jgi:hypothetical protein